MKAVLGAAMIAGGIAAAVFSGGTLLPLALALIGGGISMEAAALAQTLSDQRGVGLTIRQAAGLRQIRYGMGRDGGVIIYRSTTGVGGSGGNYVVNYIIALATHSIDGIINLYLDGRQVFWNQAANAGGFHANVGCGSVAEPPATTVTISDGVITGITATGGSGFADVKPCDGYRAVIRDAGGGTGAKAWAYNSQAGGYGSSYSASGSWTVVMESGGTGYSSATTAEIQGAFTFGGNSAADNQDPAGGSNGYGLGYGIGPGGAHYDFAGKVYCEARFGDQLDGDVMASLTANDPTWSSAGAPGGNIQATATAIWDPENGTVVDATVDVPGYGYTTAPPVYLPGGTAIAHVGSGGVISIEITSSSIYSEPPQITIGPPNSGTGTGPTSPWLGGIAYIFLEVGYDATNFPAEPEIRLTMTGKNDIYDPRTDSIGYSTNWALQVADVITDPVLGMGDDTVNQAQLIAAANVCEEAVSTSQGSEKNYAQHIHYDTSTAPGDALGLMMPAAGGRLSRIGGEWYIWPAYWQGPSFTMNEGNLVDGIQWVPYRSFRDLINRINGTFIAPNSPYNVAGNLYDLNGWYYGTIANLWPLAWQPTNFPQYACDELHGYGEDVFLTADNGVQLPKELTLRGVISIVQAQRLAKIDLLRNRQQGSGLFKMSLAAWQMQPLDVMQFTFAKMGWSNKYLEIEKIQFLAEPIGGASGEEGALALTCAVSVQESDPSVYEWSSSEELTPYDIAANPGSISSVVPPPTSLSIEDDSTTALINASGVSVSRALVTWTPPNDTYVNNGGLQQIQYAFVTALGAGPIQRVPVSRSISGGSGLTTTLNISDWVDAGSVSGSASYFYIDTPGAGAYYGIAVQIRAVRSGGAASVWVQDEEFVAFLAGGIGTRPHPLVPVSSPVVEGAALGAIAAGIHSESLTDDNGNFIFDASLSDAGDIITVVGVPN